jgi:hypothetical protein
MKTFEFIFIMLYLSFNQMWLNTYIGTLEVQLKEVYNEGTGNIISYGNCLIVTVATLMTIFSVVLPVGFLGSPVIGYMLDNKGKKTVKIPVRFVGMKVSFTVLGSGLVLFSFLNLFKYSFAVQVINTILFTFVRALFYAAVVAFYFKVFGYKSFGRLFGVSQVVSGEGQLVSKFNKKLGTVGFLQSAFLNMTYNFFDGNFFAMNLIQLVSVLLLSFFPLYWKMVDLKRLKKVVVE